MVTETIFFNLGAILIIATVAAYLSRILKQPLIPAYIITGVLLGPTGFALVQDQTIINTFAEFGIAFLLFVVGLELDFSRLKTTGFVATAGGIIQMAILFIAGFLVSLFLGFIQLEAIYVALIIAFSSTFVVVKMLSDKKELDTLHGRILIGILLMQDIIAILALAILHTLNNFSPSFLIISILQGVALLGVALLFGKFVFPPLFKFAAKTQELLFLLSISVCFLFSIFALNMNYSIAIGAFIAGVTLANLPYNYEIIGRVKPLRDFFATSFFVSLGMQLQFSYMNKLIIPMMIIGLFVVLIKPTIIMISVLFFGYSRSTAFKSAFPLAQMSEFSLIIMTQGLLLKHISKEFFTMGVMVGIITIVISTYFIQYDEWMYKFIAKPFTFLDKIGKAQRELDYHPEDHKYHVIMVGVNRIGYGIIKTLKKIKKKMFVVDYNPEIVRDMIRQNIPCMYGDIGDIEIIERLNIKDAQIIISTVPHIKDNIFLIRKARDKNKKVVIFVTASEIDEALKLYDVGADYVILPHFLGGDRVSYLLQENVENMDTLLQTKLSHIKELHHRKRIGHEHPKN